MPMGTQFSPTSEGRALLPCPHPHSAKTIGTGTDLGCAGALAGFSCPEVYVNIHTDP